MRFEVRRGLRMLISSDDDGLRPDPHFSIANLTAGYGGPPIVSEVSLGVGRGEITAVVGPNGAGKSTLLKALMGMIRPSAGTVRLAGDDLTSLPPHALVRKGVGYVPQLNDVFPELTVRENLEMGGYLLPARSIGERIGVVTTIFPALQTLLDRLAGRLSGGERKMVAVARVLMMEPSVLVLDEPTANLSPELTQRVLGEHVRALADRGTAVLLVEQKVQAALEVADWACVLVSGAMRLAGPSAEVAAREDLGEIFLGARTAETEAARSASHAG